MRRLSASIGGRTSRGEAPAPFTAAPTPFTGIARGNPRASWQTSLLEVPDFRGLGPQSRQGGGLAVGYKMDLHSDEFLTMLMRRQFLLSSSIASVFVAIILAVPLANRFLPELMNTPVLGFTFTWLFLGFLIFPILIGLAFLFVRRSNAFEDEAIGMVDPATLPKHDDAPSDAVAAPAGLGH
jgi:uncharacterized membrane protein (DUF485 family)